MRRRPLPSRRGRGARPSERSCSRTSAGYTAYTREQGDEAGAALARQFAAVVERLAPKHAGTLQELRGDEALVVFDSARRRLRFALELQRAVEASSCRARWASAWTPARPFRSKAATAAARSTAPRGCARWPGPGEVLASDAVRELAGTTKGSPTASAASSG